MAKVPCGGFELGEGLSMVDNKLTASGGGGGGGIFYAFMTIDSGNTTFHLDKDYDAMLEAFESGKLVLLVVNGIKSLIMTYDYGSQKFFAFETTFTQSSSGKILQGNTYMFGASEIGSIDTITAMLP